MIVDGAELLGSRTDRYVRRAMFLSADRSVLAVVGEGRHGLYRVERLRRHKDPYYRGGEGWSGSGESSVTDSLEAAERLARAAGVATALSPLVDPTTPHLMPQLDLPKTLVDAGYERVALTRSGVGHFHAAGTLGGRAVAVLVDTGASSTVVDVALARAAGFELTPFARTGGGAGGAGLEILAGPAAELALGTDRVAVLVRLPAVLTMDLAHVNASLAQRGEPPVDVVLGADVLAARLAVIDYGSSSLYLAATPT